MIGKRKNSKGKLNKHKHLHIYFNTFYRIQRTMLYLSFNRKRTKKRRSFGITWKLNLTTKITNDLSSLEENGWWLYLLQLLLIVTVTYILKILTRDIKIEVIIYINMKHNYNINMKISIYIIFDQNFLLLFCFWAFKILY